MFGVFLVRIFPHSNWIRRDTEYLSMFSPNAGKYGSDNLRIRTLFTQWDLELSNILTHFILVSSLFQWFPVFTGNVMKCAEAVVRRCSAKWVFLKFSQNSQENTCVEVPFLIKLPATLLKKESLEKVFPNEFFENFENSYGWILLNIPDAWYEMG